MNNDASRQDYNAENGTASNCENGIPGNDFSFASVPDDIMIQTASRAIQTRRRRLVRSN